MKQTVCLKTAFSAVLLIRMLVPAPLYAAEGTASPADETASETVDFSRDVLPVLSNKCFVCHGPDAEEEDFLRLDRVESATADRGGYRAIDQENPGESELLKRIHSDDAPMPPADADKQLTEKEKDLLTRWIRQGGEYAQHWAFTVPRKVEPPVDPQAASRNRVDAFVRQRLSREGLEFAPEAGPATLARRAAVVLTGLPPEPEQLERFLADPDEAAYRRLVDELHSSPRFGEHQARYWLDAVRYGDTHGLHLDNRRGIYPYRDWVVRAFNKNLPLDEFITWQLAGDLLESPDIAQLVATGYVRLNPSTGEGGAIAAEFQMKNNFDRVETLGTVFLGLSLVCSRCHNHKYDPITQTDYYQLLAFFNSTAEPPLDGNKYEYGPTVKVPRDQAEWNRWKELLERREDLLRGVDQQVRAAENLSADMQSRWRAASESDRLEMLSELAAEDIGVVTEAQADRAAKLQKQIEQLKSGFTTSLIAKDRNRPRVTRVLHRGEYDRPTGDPVSPGVPKVLGTLPEEAPQNRLGLAKWLTSPEHPLTSRVIVNRLWQRIFGAGLVRTPEDFGLQGQQPTHPQLLDWLAVELQDNGWNLKHMLRLLVTSRTFRQSSKWRADVEDPENRLLARGPGFRLDAEVIRDVGLWASGLLDPHMGGEGVKPYQPAGMWKALAHPASNTKKYQRDQGAELYRRSLYVYWKRTSPHPMMTLFDAPDRESSCVRRSRTSTAQQSLGLLNETQRIEMARKLAGRLMREAATDDTRLNLLFRLLACREPTGPERQACRSLLKTMRKRYEGSEKDALALLSPGEAPRDESLAPAEQAAWTQVAITVLASDIAILLY